MGQRPAGHPLRVMSEWGRRADAAEMSTDAERVAEVARLRAERDAARAALDQRGRRAEHRAIVRRWFVGILVLLFAVLLPVTVVSAWVHRTVLNTDAYVATVAPIARDPAVTEAVSRQVTDQLYAALDPQKIIADALPPRASFLATPIANGAKDAVQQSVNSVLASDQFQQVWVSANRFAHAELVGVLRGDDTVLQATNGQVVLNLVPLVNRALQRAQSFVSGVVDKPVTLPTVTSDELPSAACARIAAALDRPLPSTCGQIPLFRAAQLDNARRAVQVFDRGVLALLIVTPLLAAAALWLSRRRRRTLLQLVVGAMLGLVVVRRVLMWQQDQLLDVGRPENREARKAILHDVLSGFYSLTWWILLGGLAVVAVALVTGPYRWAVTVRTYVASASMRVGTLAAAAVRGSGAATENSATVGWLRRHFDLLRAAGVIVALLVLLVFSLNVWGALVVLALLAIFEVGLYRLRPPRGINTPPSRPSSA